MSIEGAGSDVATAGPEKENEQQLRLALAMRGGASMAVWIGGAVAEINRLRRALSETEPHAETHPWAAVARLAGYDSVSVDVLAGASAGGLNATLLSASVVYGMPFDQMRDTWIRLADLDAMSRPVPKFWHPRPPSLLDGDGYFRSRLARAIEDNVPSREAAPDSGGQDSVPRDPGDRADLLLTATLLDPALEKRFDGSWSQITQERRTASFRFRHHGRPGQPMSDFGSGKDFDDTAMRLAHAARATSSYPFAFEPAQVHAATRKPPSGEPDMFGVFSEVAPTSDAPPFRVIDGGVLDNIPVTAAIRSIASASADRPTDRWLLYLNPEPIAAPEHRRSRLALPVAATALQAKLSQESLLEDIEALDEHNRLVERLALRRKALFAELRAAPPGDRHRVLARQAATVEPEHAVVRAELDAQAVHQLLTEPAGTEDGRLLPPVVGDPLEGWSGQARSKLARRLSDRLGEQAAATPVRVFDDVRGLLSRVQECIDWARDVERWVPPQQAAEVGGCKAALYRMQLLAQVLEGHADRYWINGAKLEPIVDLGELDDWVDRVAQRRHRLQHQLPSPIRPLLGAVLEAVESGTRFQCALAEFADELLSIVESSGADAVADGGVGGDADHVNAVAEATALLHRMMARLAAAAPERKHVEEPEQLGYALLEQAERRPAVLRQLVVLTAPLDVGRVPGARIKFRRVVADEQSPLPFTALRGGERATLRLDDKIRGGDVGNFGGFLSAKWRANDWMWGRLDAVPALVGVLLDPERLVRQNHQFGSDRLGDALQAIVSTPSAGELGELDEDTARQWRDFLAELWTTHGAAVRAELDALFQRPEDEHPLPLTRYLLVERLQWTIAAREIPFVSSVRPGANPDALSTPPTAAPEHVATEVRQYSVGRQRLRDLAERRTATMATRLGLLAYRAVRPTGRGIVKWLARWGMTLLKPVLMVVALAVAAPRRTALVAFLAATAVAATGAGGFPQESSAGDASATAEAWAGEAGPGELGPGELRAGELGDGDRAMVVAPVLVQSVSVFGGRTSAPADWSSVYDFSGTSFGPGVLLAVLLAIVFAVWLGWQFVGRGRGLARWGPALFVAAALLGVGFWALSTGFRLEPMGLALAAVALTGLATVAYQPLARVLAMAVTAAVFALVLLLYQPTQWSGSGWIIASLILSGYAHVALLGTVDVLRPRPRPAETGGRGAEQDDHRAQAQQHGT